MSFPGSTVPTTAALGRLASVLANGRDIARELPQAVAEVEALLQELRRQNGPLSAPVAGGSRFVASDPSSRHFSTPSGPLRVRDYAECLVQSSLDMIISVDNERRIFEFNPAAEAAFGYSKEELLGRPVDILYAEPPEGKELSAKARETGFSGEVLNRRKNGELFYCYVSASQLYDDDGRVIGVMGISRDITEQKAAEQALRDAHDQLAAWNRELEAKVRERTAALREAYEDTLDALVLALDSRESATAGHSRRVALYCLYLAMRTSVPPAQLETIYRGALLHDIGKIGVPDAVLLKPGKLSPDERRVMEQHVAIGGGLLDRVGYLREAIAIPRFHHEHFDGTGYLDRLRGHDIPIAARLFAIVDVYDALRSDRPYKRALDHAAAIRAIRESAGTHFDPALVEPFLTFPASAWEALAAAADRCDRFDTALRVCREIAAAQQAN